MSVEGGEKQEVLNSKAFSVGVALKVATNPFLIHFTLNYISHATFCSILSVSSAIYLSIKELLKSTTEKHGKG